jgi:hypothetical protein
VPGTAGASVLTVIWVAASGFFSWLTGGLKRTELVGSTLILSNYLRTLDVPFSEIASISRTRLLSIRPVFVKFKSRTVVGDWISFMPPASFRILGEDDVGTRLRSLATDAPWKVPSCGNAKTWHPSSGSSNYLTPASEAFASEARGAPHRKVQVPGTCIRASRHLHRGTLHRGTFSLRSPSAISKLAPPVRDAAHAGLREEAA